MELLPRVSLEEYQLLLPGYDVGLSLMLTPHPSLVPLETARTVGLEVPRTLVTNDAAAVRAFWDECSGKVIAKMMTGFAVKDEGREKVVFTNPLAEVESL